MFTIYPTEYPRVAREFIRALASSGEDKEYDHMNGYLIMRREIDSRSDQWTRIKKAIENSEKGFIALKVRPSSFDKRPNFCFDCMRDINSLIRSTLDERFGAGVQDIPGDWYTKYFPASEVIACLDHLLTFPDASPRYNSQCPARHEIKEDDYVTTLECALRDAFFTVGFYKESKASHASSSTSGTR